mmetsp:Transcript_8480/g.11999  ORF Transcript_8480/g.11999 Transcript_8480/m.11999 type:complete len:181 (-) Transcript_8480:279-821(-)
MHEEDQKAPNRDHVEIKVSSSQILGFDSPNVLHSDSDIHTGNDILNSPKTPKNVVTIAGKQYIQNESHVVAVPAEMVEINDNEFRYWVRYILRKGKQMASLLCLGTFMCFISFFMGFVEEKPSVEWTMFTWGLLAIGIFTDMSIIFVNGCSMPEERILNRCIFDIYMMLLTLFAFLLALG